MQSMAIIVHLVHHQRSSAVWHLTTLKRELIRVFLLAIACATIVVRIAIS